MHVLSVGSSWASCISWYDVSHYLWLCNFHVWFSAFTKKLCSLSACLLPIGSQIYSHPSPVLLCVTQGNCCEIHSPSSCVSWFVGPEDYAIWEPSYIKIIQNYKHIPLYTKGNVLIRKNSQQIRNFKNSLRMRKKRNK